MRYLQDPDAWVFVSEEFLGDDYFHHRIFPEFTLKVGETDSPVVVRNEEWTRGEIRTDNNAAYFFLLFYHQTLLHKTRVVTFDDRKKSMVAPDWRQRGKGRFYFYKSDGVDFALQQFHSTTAHMDDSTALRIGGNGKDSDEARVLWGDQMRIPVVENHELGRFLGCENFVTPSTDESEQYQLFLRSQIDFEAWRRLQATI